MEDKTMEQDNSELYDMLLSRFVRYAKTYSESSEKSADEGNIPSTPQQWDMANMLKGELLELGLEGVCVTDNCYVYGSLKASAGLENAEPFALLAHIDTVEEVSGKDVKPQIIKDYAGEVIRLSDGSIIDPASDSALRAAGEERDTIITSDGTTLLGADDKAGIAAIMSALEVIVSQGVSHGKIEVIFSPDEETGHGMDKVPLTMIESKKAYTVDGGHIGELETECFNAFKSEVTFTGKSVHTGSARAIMVNAVEMASSFVSNLPHHELPETTDGYMGFYAPMEISGSVESAKVSLLLRDFSMEGMEKRKAFVDSLAMVVANGFGGGASVKHTEQYRNMRAKLDENPSVVENLVTAYRVAGVEPVFQPIRGGTDGSRLTEMGIPTPNIFTGGHNYHSRTEWLSMKQLERCALVLVALARISANIEEA